MPAQRWQIVATKHYSMKTIKFIGLMATITAITVLFGSCDLSSLLEETYDDDDDSETYSYTFDNDFGGKYQGHVQGTHIPLGVDLHDAVQPPDEEADKEYAAPEGGFGGQ